MSDKPSRSISKKRTRALCFILTLLTVSVQLRCAPRTTLTTPTRAFGAVGGKVVQARDKTPIRGAVVGVPALGVSCKSDELGRFALQLPEGRHEIHAAARGYVSMSKPAVEVSSGKRLDLLFEMLSEAERRKVAPQHPAPEPGEQMEQERLRHAPRLRDQVRVLMPDGMVAAMDLEEYLRGVVPSEMSPFAPPEALKAQAVAARCFANVARWHRPQGAHLCTTTHCQVWAPKHYETTDRAIEETRDIVATYQHAIIEGIYFGHCDGHTKNSEDVGWDWLPYFRAVECCCGHKERWGHGVGMCQSGAEAMAQQGKTHDEILKHYYTGIEIVRGIRLPVLDEIIVESRESDGTLTPAPAYEEMAGDFENSTAKSSAQGTKGQGSRYSTNAQCDAKVRFNPGITRAGMYDIYISAPNYDSTFAENTRFTVPHNGEVANGTLSLTRVTCGSRWYLVVGGVEFGADGGYLELSEEAPQHDRFVIDAARFVLTQKLD